MSRFKVSMLILLGGTIVAGVFQFNQVVKFCVVLMGASFALRALWENDNLKREQVELSVKRKEKIINKYKISHDTMTISVELKVAIWDDFFGSFLSCWPEGFQSGHPLFVIETNYYTQKVSYQNRGVSIVGVFESVSAFSNTVWEEKRKEKQYETRLFSPEIVIQDGHVYVAKEEICALDLWKIKNILKKMYIDGRNPEYNDIASDELGESLSNFEYKPEKYNGGVFHIFKNKYVDFSFSYDCEESTFTEDLISLMH